MKTETKYPYCSVKYDRSFIIPVKLFETQREALESVGWNHDKICRLGEGHFAILSKGENVILKRWDKTDGNESITPEVISRTKDPIVKSERIKRYIIENSNKKNWYNYKVASAFYIISNGNLDFLKLEIKRDEQMLPASYQALDNMLNFNLIDYDQYSQMYDYISEKVTIKAPEALTELIRLSVFG